MCPCVCVRACVCLGSEVVVVVGGSEEKSWIRLLNCLCGLRNLLKAMGC